MKPFFSKYRSLWRHLFAVVLCLLVVPLLLKTPFVLPLQAAALETFERDSAGAALDIAISLNHANRLAIREDAIVNAVYDKTELEVQTDSQNGQLFVLPRHEGSATLFVTGAGGETIALNLTASQETPPQNIVLRRHGQTSETTTSHEPLRMNTSDYSAAIKRMIRVMAQNRETPDIVKRQEHRDTGPGARDILRRLSALKPGLVSVWTSQSMTGYVMRLQNHGMTAVAIKERALVGFKTIAIALSHPVLRPGEHTDLFLLEER